MLNTTPRYVFADNLTMGKMWALSLENAKFYYSSKWKMVWKTTYMFLPLLLGSMIVLFVTGTYHEFTGELEFFLFLSYHYVQSS